MRATRGGWPEKPYPLPPITTSSSIRVTRCLRTSANSRWQCLLAKRSSSSLRNNSARNEQNTCPRIVSSHLWYIGQESSSDFIERSPASTIHSCLYFRATSRTVRSACVVNTHFPSQRPPC